MEKRISTYKLLSLLLLCLLWTGSTDVYGQKARQRRMGVRVDSLALKQQAITDSLATDSITTDSLAILNQKEIEKLEAPVDTALLAKKNDSIQNALPTEKKRFIPNSNRATWLALIIPGGGQIYNRKYWKLPIVYGGFMGCAYALSWNGKMYKDYSQAYLDIMDDDPNTKSYEDFSSAQCGYFRSGRTIQGNFQKKERPISPPTRLKYIRVYRCIPIVCDRRLCRCRTFGF